MATWNRATDLDLLKHVWTESCLAYVNIGWQMLLSLSACPETAINKCIDTVITAPLCHAHSWFYGGIIYLYWFVFGCELILDFILYFRLPALGSICLIALLLSRLEVWGKRGPCSIFLFAVWSYSFPKTASLLSVNAWSHNNSILVSVINRWPETNVNPSVLCSLWYSNTEAGGDGSGSSSPAGLSCKRSVYAPLLRSSDLDSVVKTKSKLEALYCDYATRSCAISNERCLSRLPLSSNREKRSRTE